MNTMLILVLENFNNNFPMTVNFATFNVAGLRNDKKRKTIFRYLQNKRYWILFLQETHCSREKQKLWEMEWQGEILWANGTNNSRGVAILFNKRLSYEVLNHAADPIGRWLMATIKINGTILTITNIYGPNRDEPQFFEDLFQKLLITQYTGATIIGGDFNVTINPALDRNIPTLRNKNSHRVLTTNMTAHNLSDPLRFNNPGLKVFTRIQNNPYAASRIDYFLVSKLVLSKLRAASIVPGVKSDHCVATFEVMLDPNPRGRGTWKLNSTVLSDVRYIKMIKAEIKEFCTFNPPQQFKPTLSWDALKCHLRGVTIKFCAEKTRALKAEQKEIENKIKKTESEITSIINPSLKLLQQREAQKNMLNTLVEKRTMGAIVRSRALWTEKGERSTKYFLNLERIRREKNTIFRLKSDNREITNQSAIIAELANFYQELYEPNRTNWNTEQIAAHLASLSPPRLTPEQSMVLETEVTEKECLFAINSMRNNKSPGNDGLPIEFYKAFWPTLKPVFMQAVQFSEKTGILSTTQTQGVITLVQKKDKDPHYATNYRPITLLNSDYKIISKVINNRMKCFLDDLIHKDQNGFINGRYIGDNIRLMFNMIEYCDLKQIPGAIISVDMYKAFDTISWEYIIETLKAFGFGSRIIKWIRTVYDAPKCAVTNNGYVSKYFDIRRGVRQGDPLSPTLFVMAIEMLAIELRASPFQGININSHETKLSLLADDTVIYTRGNLQDFNLIFQILRRFGHASGSVTNLNKSNAFYVGTKRNCTMRPMGNEGLAWPNDQITYLGVVIPLEMQSKRIFTLNSATIIKKVDIRLNIWSSRALTLLGKITVIKSLIIPILTYKLTVLPEIPPQTFINKLKQKLFRFIWKSKWEKINRTKMCTDIERGGAGMIDIETYLLTLNLRWIRNVLDPNYHASWKLIEKEFVDQNIMTVAMLSPMRDGCADFRRIFPLRALHKSVILLRRLFKKGIISDYRTDPRLLWLNPKIKTKQQSFLIEQFLTHGISSYHDLINEKGEYMGYNEIIKKWKVPYKETDFWSYNRLIKAIPDEWDREESPPANQTEYREYPEKLLKTVMDCHNTKHLYKTLVNISCEQTNKQGQTWATLLGIDPDWKKIYKTNYFCTLKTKFRSFQIKVNNLAIITNDKLFKFGIVDSGQCVFCESALETVHHIFCTCPKVILFWKEVSDWICATLRTPFVFQDEHFLFGVSDNPIVSCLLLCARFCVYRSKVAKNKTEIAHVLK
uniref:Pol-like protein n=1 Tax=Ciona intestinalis TaxID=7719 RepID=Q76IK6_CIOIN|nr:pol-like protein [Ciona intestinalis]